jgi:hypothetical protein
MQAVKVNGDDLIPPQKEKKQILGMESHLHILWKNLKNCITVLQHKSIQQLATAYGKP